VRLRFAPHRHVRGASVAEPMPLLVPSLSRVQAVLTPGAQALQLEVRGRTTTFVNGVACTEARLEDGDVLRFGQELVCVVVQRPRMVEAPTALAGRLGAHQVGQPDVLGLVGESAAMWLLRERVARAAQLDEHVLILGPSGVGKELVARGIWSLSRRNRGPFVSRNAATLPESLMDAELFGNIRDYPNPGMRARPGLVGEAHGGALFLDEIGELPLEQQAHLLRVLDNGEYQNLGDARVLKADLRFIGATNRAVSELKSDFGARIYLRVELPTLGERIEDLPWLVRHMVRGIVDSMSETARQGLNGALPLPDALLIEALLRHHYTLHLRELRGLLLTALTTTPTTLIEGGRITLTPEVEARLNLPSVVAVEPDADAIRQALATTGGNTTRAAELLGLPSRYALYRWMKKLGLS
jgi:DNA-binding NtrC family response regulator